MVNYFFNPCVCIQNNIDKDKQKSAKIANKTGRNISSFLKKPDLYSRQIKQM
jgi:hypothetical protein